MSMFDTVELCNGVPLPSELAGLEWQAHIENVGANFRITEDMELEKSVLRVKEDAEIGEEEEVSSDQMESVWVVADDEEDVEGKVMLTARGGVQMPIRVDGGEVIVFPQIRTHE